MSEKEFYDEEYVDSMYQQALEHTLNGQYEKAISILLQIVEASKHKVAIYTCLTNNYIYLGDNNNACLMLDKALEYEKDDSGRINIILSKADLLSDIGKYEEALEYYTTVEQQEDWSYIAYEGKAKCYHKMQNYEDAILYANKYLAEVPNDYDMYILKGDCFNNLKQYEKSAENYLKAYELSDSVFKIS